MLYDILRSLATSLALAALTLGACGANARAQSAAGVETPLPVLMSIAADFDAGRNPMYCYFGRAAATAQPLVHVDSMTTISTPGACHGIGVAYIARIEDRAFLMHALRGLIESNPDFLVVSAFYRTEELMRDGECVRAARALSVLRAAPPRVGASGAGSSS
jgi:hypothetical protein